MAGQKIFTETGEVWLKGTNDLEEGVRTGLTYTSEVTGIGNGYPSGVDKGDGTITLKNGKVVASYRSSLGGFKCVSKEVSKVVGNKIKGKEKVKCPGREKEIDMETEMDLHPPHKFKNTGYA